MRKAVIFSAVLLLQAPIGAQATSDPVPINGPAVATEVAVREEVPVTDIGTPPEPYIPVEPVIHGTLPETR